MPKTTLQPFEGQPVEAASMMLNVGSTIQRTMEVDPVELHKDDEVYLVVRGRVDKLRFDGIKDTDGMVRVHIVKANLITVVDGDLVDEALALQEKRIEEAKGVQRLPLGSTDPDAPDDPGDEEGGTEPEDEADGDYYDPEDEGGTEPEPA